MKKAFSTSKVECIGNKNLATFRPYSSTVALTSYSFGSTISGTCGNDWLHIKDKK